MNDLEITLYNEHQKFKIAFFRQNILSIFLLIGLIKAFLLSKTYHIKITNKRIIETTGLFTKSINEVELYRVQDLSVVIPFTGRLFNFGKIIVISTDKTKPYLDFYCENPEEVKDIIRKQVLKSKKDIGVAIREEQ